MIRHWLAFGFALRRIVCRIGGVFGSRYLNGPCDFLFFVRQLELVEGFGLRPEPVSSQTCQFLLELLDPVITLFDLGLEDRQLLVLQGDYRLQRGDAIGHIRGDFEHGNL